MAALLQLGVYLPPVQPYNSTLIEMCLFQVTGRKRIYGASIGGSRYWLTMVF